MANAGSWLIFGCWETACSTAGGFLGGLCSVLSPLSALHSSDTGHGKKDIKFASELNPFSRWHCRVAHMQPGFFLCLKKVKKSEKKSAFFLRNALDKRLSSAILLVLTGKTADDQPPRKQNERRK